MVTFDDHGVSGHPNHTAVSRAAKLMVLQKAVQGKPLDLWELTSTSLMRKYIGILDMPLSFMEVWLSARDMRCLLVSADPFSSYWAMKAHASQFVWYRRLFVVFSRYAYMNSLTKVSTQ
jgi:N-acetylglucosaminylphosphatidylinositol deacetylase